MPRGGGSSGWSCPRRGWTRPCLLRGWAVLRAWGPSFLHDQRPPASLRACGACAVSSSTSIGAAGGGAGACSVGAPDCSFLPPGGSVSCCWGEGCSEALTRSGQVPFSSELISAQRRFRWDLERASSWSLARCHWGYETSKGDPFPWRLVAFLRFSMHYGLGNADVGDSVLWRSPSQTTSTPR